MTVREHAAKPSDRKAGSSTSYEWPVVSGARAQYKGVSTINGAGSYRFMPTAIDGQQPDG